MRKLDALVIEFPDVYKCVGETEIDKTYEMPKSYVSYRKPRKLTDDARIKRQQVLLVDLANKKKYVKLEHKIPKKRIDQ